MLELIRTSKSYITILVDLDLLGAANQAAPNPLSITRLGLLVLAWVLYFGLHSLLASLTLKRWVAHRHGWWMRGYRLFFNTVAVLLLVPPLALTYADPGPWLWRWCGLGWWVANALAVMALSGFVWSLRWYDGEEFLGLRQWRANLRVAEDQERFRLSPLHRYVRHPWYSLGLVLVWTRDMNLALLVSAVVITLYFIIGSRLEERKLLVYHGEVYERYRRRVPGLVPSPRRFLTREEAQRLVAVDLVKRQS
jgi:methanethiol S-methyltransferase